MHGDHLATGGAASLVPIPNDIGHATSRLATAAELLSQAAQAMAAAALEMSELSQLFDSLNNLVPKTLPDEGGGVVGDRVDKWLEHELEDESNDVGSERCSSEASSGDLVHYDDEDFDLSNIANGQPKAVVSSTDTTAPCYCGPMDISQIRFSPRPPTPKPNSVYEPSTNNHIPKTEPVPLNTSIEEVKPSPTVKPATPSPKKAQAHTSQLEHKPLELATASNSKTNSPTSTAQTSTTPLGQSVNAYPKLPWGRNYIQLEEDFDAIPIISCMALAQNKTICLIPGSGALGPYGKILNSITKLKIFLPLESNPSDYPDSLLAAFASATLPSILLLASESVPHVLLEKASADCIIHWGWPENRQSYLKQITLMKLNTRSCLIIPTGNHLKPLTDSKLSDYGVIKYTDAVLGSYFGPTSPIGEARKITTQVLADTDGETMKKLYHSWLEYHGIGSTRRGDWTILDLMRYAREYAAKTLLRGPASDGSKLYPPTSKLQLPIPEWVIRALDFVKPSTYTPTAGTQTPANSTTETPLPPPPPPPTSDAKVNLSCYPSSPPLDAAFSAYGRHFVVLNEEIDAIPFILYLGLKNQKTVCNVPNPESLSSFDKLFRMVSDLPTIYPKSIGEAARAQASFASASSRLLLLQFYLALETSPLQNSKADALVCWGYPANIESYVNGGASKVGRSYLLLSSDEFARPLVQNSLTRFNITKHPLSNRINDLGNCGLLYRAREIVMEHIRKESFSPIAHSLYYSFIGYHCVGRGRPTGLVPAVIARRANVYASRVLLRGSAEDGSRRFPPVGDRPVLGAGPIKGFKLEIAQRAGLLN